MQCAVALLWVKNKKDVTRDYESMSRKPDQYITFMLSWVNKHTVPYYIFVLLLLISEISGKE